MGLFSLNLFNYFKPSWIIYYLFALNIFKFQFPTSFALIEFVAFSLMRLPKIELLLTVNFVFWFSLISAFINGGLLKL